MKKIFLLAAVLCALVNMPASAQIHKTAEDTVVYAYQKNPKLPAFRVLELDSSTIFNTYNIPSGKPVAIIYFGPECEHCQRFTESMLKSIDSLKDFRIYMFTFAPLSQLKTFYEKYHLADYKNIMMGKDYEFFFPSFFGARFVPYIAIYDKHKMFSKKFEGTATVTQIYDAGLRKEEK